MTPAELALCDGCTSLLSAGPAAVVHVACSDCTAQAAFALCVDCDEDRVCRVRPWCRCALAAQGEGGRA